MKELIRKVARRIGVEVTMYRPENSDMAKLQKMLSCHQIELVLDVGANKGQYARQLRLGGYKGRIVSFEPLSSAHKILLQRSDGDSNWVVAPRMAIGDKDGITQINISENSVSSSLKLMTRAHLEAASAARYIGTEEITISRLDSVCHEYINGDSRVFLKIDTQGFERQVLEGAEKTLPLIEGIQIELSLVPLYEEQLLFAEMINRLNALGFELYGLFPGLTDPRKGRLLQADGILFRSL